MTGGRLEDFIQQVEWGNEVWFVYNGVKYFIQGWNEGPELKTYVMSADQMDPPGTDYLYLKKGPERQPMVDEMLNLPLFQEKHSGKLNLTQNGWIKHL